jgi:hypothetical protein
MNNIKNYKQYKQIEFSVLDIKYHVPYLIRTPVYNRILPGTIVQALIDLGYNLTIHKIYDLEKEIIKEEISIKEDNIEEVSNDFKETEIVTEDVINNEDSQENKNEKLSREEIESILNTYSDDELKETLNENNIKFNEKKTSREKMILLILDNSTK